MSGPAPDLERARKHLAQFLDALSVGEADDEMRDTPRRVAELFSTLLGGAGEAGPSMSRLHDPNGDAAPVYIHNIPFYSMCAHHLVPFFGCVDIAYVPDGCVGGVGGFARAVRHFSSRPQLQERMVREIADHIHGELAPCGVLVRARARQLCMEMQRERGAGELACSAALGSLGVGGPQREEVLRALGHADLSNLPACG